VVSIVAAVVLVGLLAFVPRMRGSRTAHLTTAADQNVLLVTIDTLRGDVLSCDGGRARTPNLDRLAEEGVRFTFAHAHTVMTLPSHASILTGEFPFVHGVRDNSGYRLPRTTATLATRLKALGFATGAFVGAFPVSARFGLSNGFDVYDDRFGEAHEASDFAIAERRADAVVAPAEDWIGRQRDRWFVWVHVYDPHAPYRPPAPFADEYPGDPYPGEVAFTDTALGPLLQRVRASSRPTLVIVTGDHGEALGDHGEQTHGLFAYEATLHIPLIVAQLHPGAAVGGGVVSPAPVRHIDIVPTVLAALGAAMPVDLPGRSLIAAANGASDIEGDGIASYFESMSTSLNRGWAPLRGLLMGREKYIDLPIPELYDLASDPQEQANLARSRPERSRVLSARLEAFRAVLPGQRATEDPETAGRLRALGYVSGQAPSRVRYTERDDPKQLVDLDQAMHRAIELVEAQRFGEALPAYVEIIERRPDMPIASLHLAYLYWKLGRPGEAISTLKSAWQSGLRTDEIRTQLGIYLAETGNAREAVPLLAPIERKAQPDIDALNALGIAHARAGEAARALQIFSRVLDIHPSNALALQNIGAVHLQRGDLAAARDAFTRALAADPKSAGAHTGLGAAELKSGRRREAIDQWRRAVELDAGNYDALYDLATELVNDGRMDEARPYLERFAREAPAAFYQPDIERIRALLARRR
jgi:arylsulfatase A-like enzyme/Tfp pilus assembly protein PilF